MGRSGIYKNWNCKWERHLWRSRNGFLPYNLIDREVIFIYICIILHINGEVFFIVGLVYARQFSASGISAGAGMAMQIHIAHSNDCIGAGIIATTAHKDHQYLQLLLV